METAVTKEITLEDKVYKIRPLVKLDSFIDSVAKDGSSLYAGAGHHYYLPNKQDGSWVPILNKDEQAWFEEKLNLPKNSLTFYVANEKERHKSYWAKFNLHLTNEGLQLKTADPIDNLKYRLAKQLDALIAPTWAQRNDRAEYRFVILEDDMETAEKVTDGDKKKNAWSHYGKISNSNTKLLDILKVAGKNVAVNKANNSEFLQSQVMELIDGNIDEYLKIINDPNYEMRLFIAEGVQVKALIKKTKSMYTLPEGVELGSLESTIAYLKDPENNPVYLKIKAQIAAAK